MQMHLLTLLFVILKMYPLRSHMCGGVVKENATCPTQSPYVKSGHIWQGCGDYYIMRKPPSHVETMRAFFPGYFVNPTMRLLACGHICATETQSTFPLQQSQQQQRKKKVPDDIMVSPPYYHACCQSMGLYTFPTKISSLNSGKVEVVQVAGLEQSFYTETCTSTPGCNCCSCSQPQPFVYEAVVYQHKDPNGIIANHVMDIRFIVLPGSCKCLNIHPPGCS